MVAKLYISKVDFHQFDLGYWHSFLLLVVEEINGILFDAWPYSCLVLVAGALMAGSNFLVQNEGQHKEVISGIRAIYLSSSCNYDFVGARCMEGYLRKAFICLDVGRGDCDLWGRHKAFRLDS
ncbi:hypothetical protein CDL12_02530 [Handroanthus impetiginosus]|uniref:Uncharacterized protein n=1 Tax=Handroanthus impetiginosus TaxID=429701 RepID=A0A2G9I4R2_9LAMI|nr:hypothetical protein CDL12_02530 [Handroanthus impetiginosus]